MFPTYDEHRVSHFDAGRRDREPGTVRSAEPAKSRDLPTRLPTLPEDALRDDASRRASTHCAPSRTNLQWWNGELTKEGQAHRSAAHLAADDVRSRNDQAGRLLPRHRKLLAPLFRTAAGAGSADAARLSCRRTSLMFIDESHQTIPQLRAMYPRRPLAQRESGEVRLPAAERAGQSPADV